MENSFVLIHAEAVNGNRDAVCHLILVCVENGEVQAPLEYFINPETEDFEWVQSNISEAQVSDFPSLKSQVLEIWSVIRRFSVVVSSGDGYAVSALYGTLMRLNVPFEPFSFFNAKGILRCATEQVSYSLEFLANSLLGEEAPEYDKPAEIATFWARFIIEALNGCSEETLRDFLVKTRAKEGLCAPDGFKPALLKHPYSKSHCKPVDFSDVVIEPREDNPLYGRLVVFTGKMQMPRADARKAVVRIGGYAPERLTQDTDYLVVGVQDLRVVGASGLSGKMKTAQKYREKGLPIEVISESDFIEMLQG